MSQCYIIFLADHVCGFFGIYSPRFLWHLLFIRHVSGMKHLKARVLWVTSFSMWFLFIDSYFFAVVAYLPSSLSSWEKLEKRLSMRFFFFIVWRRDFSAECGPKNQLWRSQIDKCLDKYILWERSLTHKYYLIVWASWNLPFLSPWFHFDFTSGILLLTQLSWIIISIMKIPFTYQKVETSYYIHSKSQFC